MFCKTQCRIVRSLVFFALCVIAFPLLGQDASDSDKEIRSLVEDRLARIEGLDQVDVIVEGGVVTLTGVVSESSLRSTASEIVSSQTDVIEVRNELVLGGVISERVSVALDRVVLKLRMLVGYLPLVVIAILILSLFALVARFVVRPSVVRKLAGDNRFLQEVVRQGLKIGVFLIGLVVALDILDAGRLVAAVFGAAGLAGLAIGFAFKDLIENYVASLLLSLRRPFRPGDHVVIDTFEGKVVSLNTRSTILMTLEGNHLRIPNAAVFKSSMLNYTTNSERRFDFVVGVGVDEDLVEAQRIGVETLRELRGILNEPKPWAAISGLGDSSVTIQFFGWVDQTKFSFVKVKGEAIRRVKTALEAAGMDLPEPIHRLKIERRGKASSEFQDPKIPTGKASEASGDVAVDDSIDRQVAEELIMSKDENLLL